MAIALIRAIITAADKDRDEMTVLLMSDWQEERRRRDGARRDEVMSLPVLQVRRHGVIDGQGGGGVDDTSALRREDFDG